MNTVKRMSILLAVLALIPLARGQVVKNEQPAMNEPPLSMTIDLVDGSRLVGVPGIASIPVQTAYAKLDIALKQVQAIKLEPDRELAVFEMRNGDRIKGAMILKTVVLRTAFGKVPVDLEYIRNMRVMGIQPVFAVAQYVSPAGNDANDGSSWALAKKTIQAGVDAASAGQVVWVTDGVYSTGGRVWPGATLLNRVLATNGVIIRSVNGPVQTIIDGGGALLGSTDSVRPALVDCGSRLEGFTLVGGSTLKNGDLIYDQHGGGVIVGSKSVVSNCIIKQCSCFQGGGGALIQAGGGVTDCQIISNSAGYGGGVELGSDTVGDYVRNCVMQYNASGCGGGALIYHVGEIRNCLITDNTSSGNSGGVDINWGSRGAHVENCTITRNSAPTYSGIGYTIDGAMVKNSIIWDNTDANWAGGSYEYSCLTPAATGIGNITRDPLFVDSANDNFRLAAGSPCINAGIIQDWMTNAVDLDGNSRIVNDGVDIGAYEYTGIYYPARMARGR